MNIDGFALPIKKLKGIEPVESLDFSRKKLGPASAVVIASLISANASLTSVCVVPELQPTVGAYALTQLFDLCAQLDLSSNNLAKDESILLVDSVVAGSAAEDAGLAVGDCLLSCNGQAVTSRDAFVAAKSVDQGKGSITVRRGQAEFEVTYRTGPDGMLGITRGPAVNVTGIQAISDALRVNASLTKLDARFNMLGEEVKAALRKAVEARSGFKLEL